MWSEDLSEEYRGFRFNPADLPDEFRHPTQWRNYLFTASVPGYVVDEEEPVAQDRTSCPEKLWFLYWDCPLGFVNLNVPEPGLSTYRYSFNPDENHCHNCVTWATLMVNSEVGREVFPKVRNGRIKLAFEEMKRLGAECCDEDNQ